MTKAPSKQIYNPGDLQTNAKIPNTPRVDSKEQPSGPAQMPSPVVNVVTPIKEN